MNVINVLQRKKDPNPFLGTLQVIFYFLSFLIFFLGADLIAVSLWSLIKKLPYYILLKVKIDITYFTFTAAALCLPLFWIFLSAKWNEVRAYLLHSLLTLHVISISILIAAPNVGFMYTCKEGNATRLTSSLDRKNLNSSLQLSLLKYDSSKAIQFAWSYMQLQLTCCGIETFGDWDISGQEIPLSCYAGDSNCHKNYTFTQGCLEPLCRDLVWQKNILTSQCYIGVVVHIVCVVIAAFTYVSAKQFEK